LTLAGEFECMREYYEDLVAASEELEPAAKHYAAAAYARLGNNAKAKELWKAALKEAPGLKHAKINLSDMEAPAGTRSGPWSHVVDEYVPLAAWHDILHVMTGDPDLATESWETLLSEWPELLNIAPIVLDLGDDLSRKIVLSVLLNDEIEDHKDVLLRFASGQNGSDQVRAGVYFYLAEDGLLAPGSYTFWHNGERREIPTYEIPLLSSVAQMNPTDSDVLAAEPYAALNEERFAEALDGFKIALAKDPDSPMLRNNIAAAYKGLGDEQKYIEIISDLFDDYPDYTFARTNMALIQMDAGNLDAARGLLKPLSERNALRPSEYEAVYTALMRLATLEGDTDAAQKWLDALEQAAPASELVTNWKQRLLDKQDYGAPRPRGKKKNRTTQAQKTLF
jgi:tetratricopeptide (TPR) repeat protein